MGPSKKGRTHLPATNPTLPVPPTIQELRAKALAEHQSKLETIVDRHDDLIREAFHLEKFVTLTSYDPKTAKQDSSPVFQQFRAPYDLIAQSSSGAFGSTARKTRRAVNDRRSSLNISAHLPQLESPQTTPTKHAKGKQPARDEPRVPVAPISAKRGPGRPPRTSTSTAALDSPEIAESSRRRASRPQMKPRQSVPAATETSPPLTIVIKRGPGRPARPSISSIPAPPTNTPAVKRGPGRPPRKSLPESLPSDTTPSAPIAPRGPGRPPRPPPASPTRVAIPRASKNKANEPPEGPRPTFKRIKLIHRPPVAVYTNPRQIPEPPQYGGSVNAYLNTYIELEPGVVVDIDELEEEAREEAPLRSRIDSLRRENRLVDVPLDDDEQEELDLTPLVEPVRKADYLDTLRHQALEYSKHFREESKNRTAGCRKVAKMIQGHFERVAGAEDRNRKQEEKRLRILAKNTMKAITQQWRLAVMHIHEQQREVLKAEEARIGKKHLDAILEQSGQMLEAQQTDLNVARMMSISRSGSEELDISREWGEQSASGSEKETDGDIEAEEDEDLQTEGGEEDGYTGIRILDEDEASQVDDVAEDLSQDGNRPLPMNGTLSPAASDGFASYSRLNGGSRHGDTNGGPSPSSSPPHRAISRNLRREPSLPEAGSNEDLTDLELEAFTEEIDLVREAADRALELEMEEADNEEEDDDDEVDGLGKDAEVPIEELLKQYGCVRNNILDDEPLPKSLHNGHAPLSPSLPEPRPRRKSFRKATDDASSVGDTVDPDLADVEFAVADMDEDKRDDADREMEAEMEQEDEDDEGSEMDGLMDDGDLPLDELMKQYGYAPTVNLDQPNGTTDQMTEDFDIADETTTVDAVEPSVVELGAVVEVKSEGQDANSGRPNQSVDGYQTDEEEEGEDDDMVPRYSPELDDGKVRTPFLLRGTLRPYQQSGLEWLASLYGNRQNGILADEMGLGKTIQTISLLAHLACNKGIWGPHLIIVPTSVLLNWEMEFKKFLPGFKILTYYGNPKQRKERRVGWNTEHAFNVCITSYTLALTDAKIFRRKGWHYMILDEAHMIKNFKSQRWQTMLGFKSYRRLLLTGTPLQNNLTELWSLLYFLMTGVTQDAGTQFANHREFGEWFSNPVEKAIEMGTVMDEEMKSLVNKLHTVLRPYLLRRLKADVEKELPGKYEHLVYCRLSKRQRFLYDEFMSRAQTQDALASGVYQRIANILMQLRKVCNHPDLFEVRPVVTSFAMTRSAVANFEIKDLLIRKRLMEQEEGRINWSLIGAVTSIHEPDISVYAAHSRESLDASASLPFIFDDPGEPPPHDLRTIDGCNRYTSYQKHVANIARWKQIAYVNRQRCTQHPLLGRELITCLRRLYTPLMPLSVLGATDPRKLHSVGEIVSSMIKSPVDRAQEMRETIDHFAFVTPAVVARDMSRFALAGGEKAIINAATENPNLLSVLDQTAGRLQISFPDPSLVQYDCGKLQELASLLRERKAGGHRVLIFTQMTKILDILEIFLNYHGYRYLRLDGATKIEDRQIVTERFNIDNRVFAFIASSRSGGVGINLTGADTVVFYDSDFNPQMDRQCEDRAHRIGQIRDVHIYRFIAQHTVEESMLRKANQKRSLDDLVIQKGQFDWRRLFASDNFDDGGDEGLRTAGVDINAALEKALGEVEDLEDANAARVAAAEAQDLEVVDKEDFFDQGEGAAGGVASGVATNSASHATSREGTAAGDGDGEGDGDADGDEEDEEQEQEQEEPAEEDGGTVSDYMIAFVERDWEFFSTWKL